MGCVTANELNTYSATELTHRLRNNFCPSEVACGALAHVDGDTAREIRKPVRKGSAVYMRCSPAVRSDLSSGKAEQKSNASDACGEQNSQIRCAEVASQIC
jgi:hypothetical protein